MSTRPTPEYVEDVPYVRQFVPELSPAQIRLGAALGGLVPPDATDFDYCELGCGHGDSLAALAAAYPNARFLGVDIIGEHISSAKRLAREGALDNIGFLERDLTTLVDEDLGEMDFIAAHGVLSWVSPDVRAALMAFARAKLKPGGLLYVTYNAMPGWASVEPLRQLLLSPIGGDAEMTTLARAEKGLLFAHAMEKLGAQYFVMNPSARTMLETMTKAGLPYVVHEYLHEHWTPMYFARVAWEMATHDLHFASVLPAWGNFRDLTIPASLEGLFIDVSDRLTFESLKDFAINEFFRRDIYVKGRCPRSADATRAYLDATPWGLVDSPDTRETQPPHRTVSLADPIFERLERQLADGARSVGALGDELDATRDAIKRLVLAERVRPMISPTTRVPCDPDALYELTSVYNHTMVRRAGTTDAPLVLASTRAGTGFTISALDALALRLLTEVRAGDRPRWISDFVERSVLRLRVGDRVIATRDEQAAEIRNSLTSVQQNQLSKMVELGLLRRR